MFEYEINESTDSTKRILIKIAPGKTYLSAPDIRLMQNSQKGGTCWYYALNNIRARLGNNFDCLHLEDRNNEELVSALRKDQTKIDEKHEYFKLCIAIRFEGNVNADHTKVEGIIHPLETLLNNGSGIENREDLEKEVIFYDAFLAQNDILEIENFREYIYQIELANLYYYYLGLFGEVSPAMPDHFTDCPPNEKLALAKAQMVIYFFRALRIIIALYKLEYADWKPVDGIDALIDLLKLQGPCVVAGKLGANYSKPELLIGDIGDWAELYQLEYEKKETQFTHAITVIGAEHINQDESIYLIDSNDSSDPLKKRKVHKLPFADFIDNTVTYSVFHSAYLVYSGQENKQYFHDIANALPKVKLLETDIVGTNNGTPTENSLLTFLLSETTDIEKFLEETSKNMSLFVQPPSKKQKTEPKTENTIRNVC